MRVPELMNQWRELAELAMAGDTAEGYAFQKPIFEKRIKALSESTAINPGLAFEYISHVAESGDAVKIAAAFWFCMDCHNKKMPAKLRRACGELWGVN
jgi:hypothetical protein